MSRKQVRIDQISGNGKHHKGKSPYRARSLDLPAELRHSPIQVNSSHVASRASKLLYLEIKFGKIKLQGLLDSGSSLNIIGANAHNQIISQGFKLEHCKPFHVTSANGVKSFCTSALRLPITIRGVTNLCIFYIIPGIEVPLILGIEIWELFGLIPNDIQFLKTSDTSEVNSCRLIEPVITDYEFLTIEQQLLADNIIKQFQDISTEKVGLGRTSLLEHTIDTGDAKPIKQRYYRLSPAKLKEVNEEVDKMLELGVIEPSISPWNNPILMVPKRDGSNRFCLDSRKLNSVTKKYSYGIPYISDILDNLGSARYLSTIDLSASFWQVPLSPESKLKTAFTVPYRNSFHFKFVPFGISNAAAVLQSLMDSLFSSDFQRRVFVYLDDIIITGSTFEEHASLLTQVLERLKFANLTVNLNKCKFFRPELEYLGHVVDRFGLRVNPAKVSAITAFPTPKTKKEVRRFLGMSSWYRRFIENFASKAAPLNQLTSTKPGSPKFSWSPEAEKAFNSLKAAISTAPVLARPRYDLPFKVYTDASAYGTGGVLTQGDGEEEKPVAFTSHTLTAAERNYSATEREALAVLNAVEKWRCYLEGGEVFEIHSDHAALRWFLSIESPTGRLARWGVRLSPYNFRIFHRKGSEQTVPDALSRAPLVAAITISETKDTWFQSKYQEVLNSPQACPNMTIMNGKLYRYSKADGEIDPEFMWKEVIMLEDQPRIIKEYHDKSTAGHLGVYKTYHRLRQFYYFPGMFQTVAKYIANCDTCMATKHVTAAPLGTMNTPKKCTRPFEYIACDVHGPMPTSRWGNRYILLVTCCFSKYSIIIPLKEASSSKMIPLLKEKVFLVHGVPRVFLTDNGKIFVSKEMRKFLEEHHIPHIFNTPYYTPQVNPVERYNRTLSTMLRAYVEKNHKLWDSCLPELQYALNSAKSESSGFSPNFLVYGRELVSSGEVYSSMTAAEAQVILMSPEIDDRLEKLGQLEKYFTIVRDNLGKQHSRNKRYYDRGRRSADIKKGDIIWKRTRFLSDKGRSFSTKLAPVYEKFRIAEKLSDTVFKLETLSGKVVAGSFHSKDFKLQGSQSQP